jgi:uncharacterized OB-fold protein
MDANPDFPIPDLSFAPLQGFWQAAAQKRLSFPRCDGCETFCWYPKSVCPRCAGDNFIWTEVKGPVRLFSHTIVRRALHGPLTAIAPYAPVIIEFDHAPNVRLVTRSIGDPEKLRIGNIVNIRFEDLGYPNVVTGILAPLVA